MRLRLRALVVDDEPALRRLLDRILRGLNFEVTVCARGDVALEWLAAKRFDLLVTDLSMPGLHGSQLVINAQPLYRHLPILAISGSDAFDVTATRCSSVWLPKPFTLEQFTTAVVQLTSTPCKCGVYEKV